MQTITQLTQHNYFTNCAEVSDENFNLLTQQQQTQFTQAEAAFVLQFVADTVASLTAINVECAEEEQYFVRLTDALEVLANLQMLYNNLDADSAVYNFTLAQAAQAICCYDTEYRETICEQFEDACNTANFNTLALRVICSY
jgi:hypothetical protein